MSVDKQSLLEAIVSGKVLVDWPFYLTSLALLFLTVAASSYLGAYFKSRGEKYATKTDFDDLLRQQKRATQAAESIKTAISQQDWITRENRTLRRIKLEELMEAVYESTGWLELEKAHYLFNAPNPGNDPFHKMGIIAQLYFPELKLEINRFNQACLDYRMWVSTTHQIVLNAKEENPRANIRTVYQDRSAEYEEVYKEILNTITAIEEKASELMSTLLYSNLDDGNK